MCQTTLKPSISLSNSGRTASGVRRTGRRTGSPKPPSTSRARGKKDRAFGVERGALDPCGAQCRSDRLPPAGPQGQAPAVKPDLTVPTANAFGVAATGWKTYVTVTVKNLGPGAAPQSKLGEIEPIYVKQPAIHGRSFDQPFAPVPVGDAALGLPRRS